MYKKNVKRGMDFLISLFLLVTLSPIYILIYVLIKIDLGGPVIFKQKRPGLNETVFTLYKFRTMKEMYDKSGTLRPDSERITKFGKILRATSLDELPSLINILLGHMSLVGPRPLLVKYLDYYSENEKKKHDVRPGLTGLAQINGRNLLKWESRFQKDLEYVENISFGLDMYILAVTLKKVLKKDGVIVVDEGNLKDLDIERSEKNENCLS